MKNTVLKSCLLAGAAALTLFSPLNASAAEDLEQALIKDGKFFGQMRYRYEYVDQDGFAENAYASTVRTNLGYKTGVFYDFQALFEAQLVHNIGANEFNNTVDANTANPVVADPNSMEINQAWLSWAGLPSTTIKAGREAINIDNQRFIGTVGWRQNDQTFDNVNIINTSIPDLTLLYSFVWNVNRINGGDHPRGDLNTDTHLLNASYNFADWLKVTGYGYFLDIDRLSNRSSKTYGLRLTGKAPLSEDWNFFYEAEGATQDDHGNNAANYDENYYHLSPGIKGHGFTFQAGYEELGGDGTSAFQTPLATLHKFNGWADKFLGTPANGLEDMYGKVSYKVSGANKWVDGTKLTAVYHDFDSEGGGPDYGSELDLAIGKSFTLPKELPGEKINFLIKYADFDADSGGGLTDTQKVWFQVNVKF